MKLQGARVLITGGSSGIGKATAKLLLSEGAKVLITGRDEAKLTRVATEIGAIGVCCDVSVLSEIDKLFEAVDSELGGIDCLINNAGIGKGFSPLTEVSPKDMEDVWRVNVLGATMVAKEAAKRMIRQKSGSIVNIASTASVKGYQNGSVYSSTKFALRSLTQCWQAELRKDNIRVIQVNPSYVATAFGRDDRVENTPDDNKLSSDEIAHTIKATLEMDDRGYIPEVTIHATNPF